MVAIVGGMSTEMQERLLKARPEIIVGTPGRLWELMSGGEKHLVEVCHAYVVCMKNNTTLEPPESYHTYRCEGF